MSTAEPSPIIDGAQLEALESAVGEALRAGSDSGLDILGYGEISLVLGWPIDSPAMAAKRLPVFKGRDSAERYGHLVEEYLAALPRHGITPVHSEYHLTRSALGTGWAAYVVQPILPAEQLAPAALRAHGESGDRDAGAELVGRIVESIVGSVDRRLGLDGQLSNWADSDSGLVYFDVTTPLLTDDSERSRLDLGVLTSPLPAFTRPLIRRFVAPGITARYHRCREVLLDLAANLLKERLEPWVPTVLELANPHLDQPITEAEVRKYYRSDAVTWEILLRLRKLDREWQRRVRRRTYAALLPHDVQR